MLVGAVELAGAGGAVLNEAGAALSRDAVVEGRPSTLLASRVAGPRTVADTPTHQNQQLRRLTHQTLVHSTPHALQAPASAVRSKVASRDRNKLDSCTDPGPNAHHEEKIASGGVRNVLFNIASFIIVQSAFSKDFGS